MTCALSVYVCAEFTVDARHVRSEGRHGHLGSLLGKKVAEIFHSYSSSVY